MVSELTDDHSLHPLERKRMQIIKAPVVSAGAKLVKLADKIANLRDIGKLGHGPIGWTPARVDAYFMWAQLVTNEMRGVNSILDDILDDLYREHDKHTSVKFESGGTINTKERLDKFLDRYGQIVRGEEEAVKKLK